MGAGARVGEDTAMTEPSDAAAATGRRRLRRRVADRVIGGVAGGLGDYFNVDPLLVRIGFAGLMIFGGAGLVLYVVAWLLVPAGGRDDSLLDQAIHRIPGRWSRLAVIGLVVVLLVIVIQSVPVVGYPNGDPYPWGSGFYLDPGLFWAVVVIALGIVVLRRHDAAPAAPTAEARSEAPSIVQSEPRLASPLGWYVIAAVLLGVGALSLVDNFANVEVELGQFFGAVLAVLGIGLVIGAWWGRARLLIVLGLLLLPLALGASFVTAPLEGGVGDEHYVPANPAELRQEYRLLGGRLVLDLTELRAGPQPMRIDASVALGQLVVILPADASITLDGRVGAGDMVVFATQHTGTSLIDRLVRPRAGGPSFVLDLEAGIGEVFVQAGGS
jgi:phage shock protein PspC (stress-responsive transcriptional regulator)